MRNQRNKISSSSTSKCGSIHLFPEVQDWCSATTNKEEIWSLHTSSPCAVLLPSKSQNNLDLGSYPAPAQSGAKLRCLRACPLEFGVPPGMETPPPLWATCHQAWWRWTKPWIKTLSDLEENTWSLKPSLPHRYSVGGIKQSSFRGIWLHSWCML